jgi:hypothetical protein
VLVNVSDFQWFPTFCVLHPARRCLKFSGPTKYESCNIKTLARQRERKPIFAGPAWTKLESANGMRPGGWQRPFQTSAHFTLFSFSSKFENCRPSKHNCKYILLLIAKIVLSYLRFCI